MENFVSRRAMGWPATPAARTITNLGTIAHYDAGFWLRNRRRELTDKHRACKEYWERVRNQHRGQGWVDVGYAYFVCPDDYIFEGRGVNHQQAAEAPTPGKMQNGNSRYVAITFGLGPGEQPTEGALRAWKRLREWLMDEHGVRPAVYGHRDFTATSCPGDAIYALKGSELREESEVSAKPKPPTPRPEPKDPDMDYASFGASEAGPTECQPNEWTDIKFDTEYADPTKAHPDTGSNPTILLGKPHIYALEFGADIEGAVPGEVIEMDTAEYVYDKTVNPPADKLVETGKTHSQILTDSLRLHFTAVGSLRKNGKLRVRVRSKAASPVKVANARVSVMFGE